MVRRNQYHPRRCVRRAKRRHRPLQESILQTTFGTNWSGRYTFWWKVSSEQFFDILEFRVNGVVQTNISGEVDWTQASIPVATGTNVLMWRYSKDAT